MADQVRGRAYRSVSIQCSHSVHRRRAAAVESLFATVAESFFATLKTEFYYRRVWPTKTRAKLAVGAWIEDRYNRRRRHSSIGQISPVTFELQHCTHTAAELQAA
jgi:transposase InsO family protein